MIMIMRISVIIEKDKDNGDEYTDDDEDQNKEHLYDSARWQGVLLLPMHMWRWKTFAKDKHHK